MSTRGGEGMVNLSSSVSGGGGGGGGGGKVKIEEEAPAVVSETELQRIYNWVDSIQLSRPKRSIARDFADGVMLAEMVSSYFPKFVDLHNYSSANGLHQKMYNWNTLNQKVFRRLGFMLNPKDIDACVKASPGAIERVLLLVQRHLSNPRFVYEPSRTGRMERGETRKERYGDTQRSSRGERLPDSSRRNISKEESSPRDRSAVADLRSTVDLLQKKIAKLEQLVRIKDAKIEALSQRLAKHED